MTRLALVVALLVGCGARSARSPEPTPVVLVHGILADASYWTGHPLVAALPGPVITVSLRGRGGTPLPAGGGLHPEQQADDIRAALDAAGARRAVIVAHSMGVPVALAFAKRWPERVVGIVAGDYLPGWVQLTPEWVANASRRARPGVPPDFAERIQADQARWKVAGVEVTLSTTHREVLAPDMHPQLARMTTPVWVLLGTRSMEPRVAELWRAPGVEVRWVDSDHAIFRHPDAIRATVEAVERARGRR